MNQMVPAISTHSKINELISPGFEALNENEKLYAYHFSRASWEGARICYFQRSYESPGLFYIFHRIFSAEKPQQVEIRLLQNGWTKEEIQQLFVYVASVFQNCGNFKNYGDSKFIPEVSPEKFEQFIATSQGYRIDEVWEKVKGYIYNFQKPYGIIDLNEKGGSTAYYSPNLNLELIEAVDQLLITKNISQLNTRIIKVESEIHVLVASIQNHIIDIGEVHGHKVKLVYGDFSPFLQFVFQHLEQAFKYVANDLQKKMIETYISHFKTGDIELHRLSQKYWIKDKGPIIETNIGFIETYLDPRKVRAEWEGLVAVINKEGSALLSKLVNKAEDIIKYLPWPKEFEVDEYKKPDFTDLEVITSAASGTFLGINLPNYDDIRQTEGFKNVSLGNVAGKLSIEQIKFLDSEDQQILYRYQTQAVFLMIALHELIGHGAGKIFRKGQDGQLNFNIATIINPLTNTLVDKFYNYDEQWHSKLGEQSDAMEECKADATALYLSTYEDVVELLLPNNSVEERKQIIVAAWIWIIYRAVVGLECYNPQQKKWGQAHVLSRNVILQFLIREDPSLITITETIKNQKQWIEFKFNQSKLYTSGKKAMSDLILHLQVYKSTGATEGKEFFNRYATITEQFLKIREIVIQYQSPRNLELQTNLVMKNQQVILKKYEATYAGIIESQVDHHQENIEETKKIFLTVQKYFQN